MRWTTFKVYDEGCLVEFRHIKREDIIISTGEETRTSEKPEIYVPHTTNIYLPTCTILSLVRAKMQHLLQSRVCAAINNEGDWRIIKIPDHSYAKREYNRVRILTHEFATQFRLDNL